MGDIKALREGVETCFPRLWPPMEAALATALAMIPSDVVNPPVCIFTGAASCSKTTILDSFQRIENITYRSDRFTPKSLVSHAANVKREQLDKIDLLPRIRHRVLVTPELAPMFRQNDETLRETFSILTAVLDGQGYISDSGTQGQRGYQGDYLFVWLGATTPLPSHVWQVMAQLGSRLLFYTMPDAEVSDEELDEALRGLPYQSRVRACERLIRSFVKARFTEFGGPRGVRWDREQDPSAVLEAIKRLARLLARCRSFVPAGDERRVDVPASRPPDAEQPYRALATLYNLARGRALLYGRRQLSVDDLPLAAHVALSSMPHERSRLLRALIHEEGHLTTRQTAEALSVSRPTARRRMDDLARLGVASVKERDENARLILRPEWRWCLDLEARPGKHTVPNRL